MNRSVGTGTRQRKAPLSGAKGALTRTPTPQHRGTETDGWISRADVDVVQIRWFVASHFADKGLRNIVSYTF